MMPARGTQWRPCLRTGPDGYELINVLRDHRIPFAAVEGIEVRYAVVIKTDGKRYTSWGAPTPPSAFGTGFGHVREMKSRPLSALPDDGRICQPAAKTGRDAIVKAWEDGSAPGPTGRAAVIVSTWNLPVLITGAVAAVCGVTAIRL